MASNYLYHATLDENLGGIQKKGLRPVKDTSQCHWGGDLANQCIGKAFITDDLGMALYYAGVIQRHKLEECVTYDPEDASGCIPEVIVLRVHRSKVKDATYDEGTSGDFFVRRTIPAKDLEYLHGEHCWKNLGKQDPGIIEGIAAGEWREPPLEDNSYKEIARRQEVQEKAARRCARRRQ